MLKPLNNHFLAEVNDEFADYGGPESADFCEGTLLDYTVSNPLIGMGFFENDFDPISIAEYLKSLVGKTVRWQQYGETGQTFEEDGKTYAYVPWWKLVAGDLNEDSKDARTN